MSTASQASDVGSQAVRGVKVLMYRTAASQVIRIVSSVIVARALTPEDFGAYAIVAYISGLGIYVQSMGLGAALIQRHEEPDEVDWRTAFFMQFIVALVYCSGILLLGKWLLSLFSTGPEALGLLAVASLQPLVGSLVFLPQTMLSRKLEFTKIATASFVSDVVGVVAACQMAVMGFGVWTLVVAPTFGMAVNAAFLNYFSTISLFGKVNPKRLLPLLRIGIPLQLTSTVPAALNGWIPYFGGRLLGASALGASNLSQRLASIPSGYLQILSQVGFPAFSRMQQNKAEAVSHIATGIYRFSAIGVLGYLLLAPWLPALVTTVYGAQWEEAGELLRFLGISTLLGALVGILGPAVSAFGHGWWRVVTLVIACGFPWLIAPLIFPWLGLKGFGATVVVCACIELLLLELIVEWKIMPSAALRWTVTIVVALFIVESLVLAFGNPHSSTAKVTATTIGFAGLPILSWVEARMGIETTVSWFRRGIANKTSKKESVDYKGAKNS